MSYFSQLLHPGDLTRQDLRRLPAAVEVATPAAAQNLADVVTLAHPLFAGSVALPSCPGIQYHPNRRCWVVLYDGGARAGGAQLRIPGRILATTQVFPMERQVALLPSPTDHEPGLRLTFPAGTAFVNVHDVISPRLVVTPREQDAQAWIAAAAPVRQQYWDLVDFSSTRQNPSWPNDGIHVHLYGNMEVVATFAAQEACIDLGAGLLEVWPSLRYRHWTTTWVAANFPAASPTARAIPLREVAAGPGGPWHLGPVSGDGGASAISIPLMPSEAPKPPNRAVCADRVRGFGIVGSHASDAAGVFVAQVLPEHELREAPAETTASVYMDFGTSRTTVVVGNPGNEVVVPPTFSELAVQVSDARNVAWYNQLLPIATEASYQREPGKVTTRRTPELRNDPCTHMLLESKLRRRKNGGSAPLVDFAIRPSAVQRSQVQHFETFGDLKWNAQRRPERVQYLEAVLLMAAAEAVAQRGAQSLSLACSYPLAFDVAQKPALLEDLREASRRVERRCGVSIPTNIPLVSESEAGFMALGVGGDDIAVTVDAGGHTVDIGVWVLDGAGVRRLACVESVYLGGDLLLEPARRGMNAQAKEVAESHILERDFLPRVQREIDELRGEAQQYVKRVLLWRDLLVEVTAVAIAGVLRDAANDNRTSVRIVAMGGAWNCLDGLCAPLRHGGFLGAVEAAFVRPLRDRLAALLPAGRQVSVRDLGIQLLENKTEKVSVALGIRQAVTSLKANGVAAPNGIEEQDGTGQRIVLDWHHIVGPGVGSNNPRQVPQATRPVIPASGVIGKTCQQLSNDQSVEYGQLVTHLTHATDPNTGERRHSGLSVVFKHFVAPEVAK